MSTVNAPLPIVHLPAPVQDVSGMATFAGVMNGLCGEAVLHGSQLSGDIEIVSCESCVMALLGVLHMQQAIALKSLTTMRCPQCKLGGRCRRHS